MMGLIGLFIQMSNRGNVVRVLRPNSIMSMCLCFNPNAETWNSDNSEFNQYLIHLEIKSLPFPRCCSPIGQCVDLLHFKRTNSTLKPTIPSTYCPFPVRIVVKVIWFDAWHKMHACILAYVNYHNIPLMSRVHWCILFCIMLPQSSHYGIKRLD